MRRLFLSIALLLTVVTTASVALAQSGPLEIPWYTIDGGGTTASSGGDFVLAGTAGQADAGISSGGIYTVQGGFWGVRFTVPLPPGDYQVYLPLIRR
jgi:acyl dehydratase